MLKREDNELLVRVGPGTPMGDYLRRFWMPAMLPRELPKPDCDPVRLRLLGENLVAFRDSNGRIGVLDELCPHRRASLFYGRNEQCGLRCVYHGWKFDVDGNCVEQPSEPPHSNFKDKIKQRSYPAREWGGFIWVYMGDKAAMPELPQFEWALLPPENRWQAKWTYEANYAAGVEGELDSAHTGFLHDTKTPQAEMHATMAQAASYWTQDKAPQLTVQSTDYGFYYGSRRRYGEDRYYWRVTQWLLPFFAIIPMPKWPISCRAYVPIDDERTMVFNTSYNADGPLTKEDLAPLEAGIGPAPELIPGTFTPKLNASNLYGLDREVQRTRSYTGIYGINNQDRAVVESMGPICDRWNEHLGTSDIAVIAMRRRMLEEARALQRGEAPKAAADANLYQVRPLDIIAPVSDLKTLVDLHAARMRAAQRAA
ncbi:MAG: Rieske 2Fe-2S domain-containing protein [Proteobacteria bacterium]|nr:Rieske 2Fe-2S domain-containing protein [Pseudomonadota bacterium]